jgi:hypothetical protein
MSTLGVAVAVKPHVDDHAHPHVHVFAESL